MLALKTKVEKTSRKKVCSLILDEMRIKKQIEFDEIHYHNYHYHNYVDMVTENCQECFGIYGCSCKQHLKNSLRYCSYKWIQFCTKKRLLLNNV